MCLVLCMYVGTYLHMYVLFYRFVTRLACPGTYVIRWGRWEWNKAKAFCFIHPYISRRYLPRRCLPPPLGMDDGVIPGHAGFQTHCCMSPTVAMHSVCIAAVHEFPGTTEYVLCISATDGSIQMPNAVRVEPDSRGVRQRAERPYSCCLGLSPLSIYCQPDSF